MLKVELGNGFVLESVISIRELIETSSGELELNIVSNKNYDVENVYLNLKTPGALDSITITDLSSNTETVVVNYTNIVTLERIFDIADPRDSIKLNIRLHKA